MDRKNTEGQSTIEFALTMMLMMAFILFFFQLGLVFAYGNFAHYITFMSARAYLAAGSADQQEQTQRASDVIVQTLKGGGNNQGADRFPSIAKSVAGSTLPGVDIGPGPEFQQGDRDSSWEQGVRYTFRSRLFLLPLAGGGSSAASNVNSITLTSESWLGREPADEDCQVQMGQIQAIFDNGC